MTLRDFYCKDCGSFIGQIEDDIIAKCPKCRSLNNSANKTVTQYAKGGFVNSNYMHCNINTDTRLLDSTTSITNNKRIVETISEGIKQTNLNKTDTISVEGKLINETPIKKTSGRKKAVI